MQFDDDYAEHVQLRDGSPALLRLLREGDAALLRRGFSQLSERSRHLRFLMPKTQLSARELDYLSHVDQRDHFALGAVRDDGTAHAQGLGLVRFVRLRERPDTADLALTVIDAVQHQGLGSLLLSRAIDAALERGVRLFHVDVLSSNDDMLQLLRERAPMVEQRVRDGVISAECDLTRHPAA